jgi:hypothetical protein
MFSFCEGVTQYACVYSLIKICLVADVASLFRANGSRHYNIKMDLREIGCDGTNWIHFA